MTRPPAPMPLELRIGTINAHGGILTDGRAIAWGEWLDDFAHRQKLDVIVFQEMTRATRAAARMRLGRTWVTSWSSEWPGSDETCIAVRRSAAGVFRSRTVRMGRRGWFGRHTGRQHTPRSMHTVDLDVGLTVAAVHAPPGVDVRDGLLTGPDDRQRAWSRYWRRFDRWATGQTRRGGAWVAAGDFNEPKRARGLTSPSHTARKHNAELRLLGIDGLMAHAVNVSDVRRHPPGPGMDHHPVTATLTL